MSVGPGGREFCTLDEMTCTPASQPATENDQGQSNREAFRLGRTEDQDCDANRIQGEVARAQVFQADRIPHDLQATERPTLEQSEHEVFSDLSDSVVFRT